MSARIQKMLNGEIKEAPKPKFDPVSPHHKFDTN